MLSGVDDEAAGLLHRELHTLKGESHMLGFTDVNLVSHKLEDMLEVARSQGYAVDEDFDLSVNMALRFMGMLVRKKQGSQLGGIDLPGFVRQIDEVLARSRQDTGRTRTGKMIALQKPKAAVVPHALREQLGPLAVDAFIEYAGARGVRRNRLRESWHAFRELIGLHRAVLGADQLKKHRNHALALAKELGKQVEVDVQLGTTEVTTEMLAALDVAALHLIRNAIDHGIGEHGTVRIHGGHSEDGFDLIVEDDGRGIDWRQIKARALELGLTASDEPDDLVEIMCQSGFSTKREAGAVSGRGVGLEAVRVAIAELGGTLSVASSYGRGTAWTVHLPPVQLAVPALVLRAAGVPFPIAIDASWQYVERPASRVLDLAAELGLEQTAGSLRTFARGALAFAIPCEAEPLIQTVRRVIATPAGARGEVVVLEAVEGLLVRPERLSAPSG